MHIHTSTDKTNLYNIVTTSDKLKVFSYLTTFVGGVSGGTRH